MLGCALIRKRGGKYVFCKYFLINLRPMCHIIVNMKMFPQNPFNCCAIVRSAVITPAVPAWGCLACGTMRNPLASN